MTTLWEARAIRKNYRGSGKKSHMALDKIDLAVEAGEIVALVGESGSGKSTLARLALGLERPDAGTLHFRGRPYADWGPMRTLYPHIQMVFQSTSESADPSWSAAQAIAEPLVHLTALTRGQRRERVKESADKVGLPQDLLAVPVGSLSGGQKQRVCIARAMAVQPEFLVLDEPTSGLDVLLQEKLLTLLQSLSSELSVAMLLITHDLKAAARCARRMAVLHQGRIIETMETHRLDQLTHPLARRLYASTI
ncbi:ATP-binding cassette domain-containing protein [Desulfonatronum parangueonense]